MLRNDWYTSSHQKYEKLMLELRKYQFTFKMLCPLLCLKDYNMVQVFNQFS